MHFDLWTGVQCSGKSECVMDLKKIKLSVFDMSLLLF